MTDIFLSQDAKRLLKNRFILFLGDSNMKSFYVDLLHLIMKNDITPKKEFVRRGEQSRMKSIFGDEVIRLSSVSSAGRDQFEEREYKDEDVHIRYHYLTKVYGVNMKHTLNDLETGKMPVPDIIILNSCVWDITRWGPKKENQYKIDLVRIFSRLKGMLPDDTLIIWTTTLPVAVEQVKGGVFIKQLEFTKYTARFMIMEANKFVQQLCLKFDIDVVDLHYHMMFQLHSRAVDGIHWEPHAIRYIICILLTHICISYHEELPNNFSGPSLQIKIKAANDNEIKTPALKLSDDICQRIDIEMKKPMKKLNRAKPSLIQTEGSSVTRKQKKKALRRITTMEMNDAKNVVGNNKSREPARKPQNNNILKSSRPPRLMAAASQPCDQIRFSQPNGRTDSHPSMMPLMDTRDLPYGFGGGPGPRSCARDQFRHPGDRTNVIFNSPYNPGATNVQIPQNTYFHDFNQCGSSYGRSDSQFYVANQPQTNFFSTQQQQPQQFASQNPRSVNNADSWVSPGAGPAFQYDNYSRSDSIFQFGRH